MAIDQPLDRLVWRSLATVHKDLAIKCGQACAFPEDIAPFVASKDNSDASMRDLGELLRCHPRRSFLMLQAEPVRLPDCADLVDRDTGVQMVYAKPIDAPNMMPRSWVEASIRRDIVPLGKADMEKMVDLATLTRPGPFSTRTQNLGHFVGIFDRSDLIAMAGERLKVPGMTEVSGVCTHPDFLKQGLASALTIHMCNHIIEEGKTPFLHTYRSNEGAIRLYKSLGFEVRATVEVVRVCLKKSFG